MRLVSDPSELVTAATDALLALECLGVAAVLRRLRRGDRWRMDLWCTVFVLMAAASVLGAVAHGWDLPEAVRNALWKPLYLALGVLVALFGVGAVHDLRGRAAARRLLPGAVATGAGLYVLTEILDGAFLVFVVYQASMMAAALGIYAHLAWTRRLRGAGAICLAILVNLAANAVQASSLSIRLGGWTFDHNGLYHLIQMAAIAVMALGLFLGRTPASGGTSS